MTENESEAFLYGLATGMVSVGAVVMVFDAPPVAFLVAGLVPMWLGYLIDRAEGGDPER